MLLLDKRKNNFIESKEAGSNNDFTYYNMKEGPVGEDENKMNLMKKPNEECRDSGKARCMSEPISIENRTISKSTVNQLRTRFFLSVRFDFI